MGIQLELPIWEVMRDQIVKDVNEWESGSIKLNYSEVQKLYKRLKDIKKECRHIDTVKKVSSLNGTWEKEHNECTFCGKIFDNNITYGHIR